MSEKKDVVKFLMEQFDKEIFEKVKKIVKKEADTGDLDEVLEFDYYKEDPVEVEVPVIFKKTGKEGNVTRQYFVEVTIIIRDPV